MTDSVNVKVEVEFTKPLVEQLEEWSPPVRIKVAQTDGRYVLVAEEAEEIKAYREALRNLLEPHRDSPCRFDHHGYCQAHYLEEDCSVAEARKVLSRYGGAE